MQSSLISKVKSELRQRDRRDSYEQPFQEISDDDADELVSP